MGNWTIVAAAVLLAGCASSGRSGNGYVCTAPSYSGKCAHWKSYDEVRAEEKQHEAFEKAVHEQRCHRPATGGPCQD